MQLVPAHLWLSTCGSSSAFPVSKAQGFDQKVKDFVPSVPPTAVVIPQLQTSLLPLFCNIHVRGQATTPNHDPPLKPSPTVCSWTSTSWIMPVFKNTGQKNLCNTRFTLQNLLEVIRIFSHNTKTATQIKALVLSYIIQVRPSNQAWVSWKIFKFRVNMVRLQTSKLEGTNLQSDLQFSFQIYWDTFIHINVEMHLYGL